MPALRAWALAGRWIVPALLVLASLAMSWTVTAYHADAFSPRDEWVYLDYLNKIPHQGFIHQGEVIGQDPRTRMACDGVRDYGPMGPACGGPLTDLALFPQQAVNTADIYTPLYFAVTRAAAGVIQVVTGHDLFHSARLVGGLWLAGTMLLFSGLLRSYRVPAMVILGVGLAFIGSPLAWWTYTYISTDAPTFAFGVAGLWIATSVLKRTLSGWWLVLVAIIAVLFKVTNLLTIGLLAVFIASAVFSEIHAHRRAAGRWLRPSAADFRPVVVASIAVVLSILAQVLWLFVRSASAVGPSPSQGNLGAFGLSELGRLAVMTIPNTIVSNSTITGSGLNSYQIPTFIVAPLGWFCIVAVVAALWHPLSSSHQRTLAFATAVATVLFVPALALALAQSQGTYFALPARYGAPLLAPILLVGALLITNRWAIHALLAYSATLVAYVLLTASVLS